jgi:hypothetical protein
VLNLSGFLGTKNARSHVFVKPYHGFEELWVVRESLAKAGIRIACNNTHHVLRILRQTVRCDTEMVRACQLAFAWSMVVLARISVARRERQSPPSLGRTV